jgi:hypothetical protein
VDLVTRAELVVTRRLHVALPAASYGTPVVAVPDPDISFARRRFAGFETILPVVYLDRIESDLKKVDWHGLQPANIPDQLKQRYINLCQTLRALKLSGYSPQAMTSLDVIGRSCQRVINLAGIRTPSQVRLRLKDRVFELRVLSWSDSHIDVALRGFPGLSKFDFMVEVLPSESQSWMAWGPLRDLVSTGE